MILRVFYYLGSGAPSTAQGWHGAFRLDRRRIDDGHHDDDDDDEGQGRDGGGRVADDQPDMAMSSQAFLALVRLLRTSESFLKAFFLFHRKGCRRPAGGGPPSLRIRVNDPGNPSIDYLT